MDGVADGGDVGGEVGEVGRGGGLMVLFERPKSGKGVSERGVDVGGFVCGGDYDDVRGWGGAFWSLGRDDLVGKGVWIYGEQLVSER